MTPHDTPQETAFDLRARAELALAFEPGEPPARDPLPTTFSTGDAGDARDLPWEVTVGGEFAELPFSEDGLVSLTVESGKTNDLIITGPDTHRKLIGGQQDDSADYATQTCPDTAELAPSPVTFTSSAVSVTRSVRKVSVPHVSDS